MEIYIEGQRVYVDEDSSFEYVTENRFFTKSETYSMAITIPLRGCPENQKIFGHITRKDIDLSKKVFKCVLRDVNLAEEGVAVIVGTTQTAVKIQFLANKAAQNYDKTFEDTYINELDIPYSEADRLAKNYTVDEAWGLVPSAPNFGKYIALPWVNDNSGNIQNEVTSNGDGVFAWGSDTEKLSFMPYLLWLTEQICEAVGFTYDFSEWDQSNWRYLLCCNTVPQAWDILNFAEGLPHWTVDEYFEELEKLMQCEVTIDYVNRHISLDWSKDVSASAGEIVINNSKLVDDFSAEMKNIVSEDEDYSYSQLYKYADSGDNESDLELCDWLIQDNPKYIKEMTDEEFDAFIETVKGMKVSAKTVFTASSGVTINGKKTVTYDLTACNPYNRIVHARDSYFIVVLDDFLEDETKNIQNSLKITYSYYSCRLEKIASFAPFLTEKEEDAATSLNIVPVSLQITDIGRLPHFDCGELAETVTAEIDSSIHAGDNWRRFSEMIEAGESESDSIFGVIRVGFHKPVLGNIFAPSALVPIVDKVMLNGEGIVTIADGEVESLRLSESRKYNDKIKFSQVNCSDKYTYEFISDSIPNVRAVFVIAGKRYLCEKITVTFTPRGMQKKLKGVFYPIGE